MLFYRKDKGIISLVAILTIGLFALSAVTISVMGAFKELKKNRNNVMGEQSFYTAEAASREGVYQYRNNTSSYSGGTLSLDSSINNILSDSISITVDDTSLPWPYLEIIGVAENKTNRREVVYTLTEFPEGLAFDYAVYSENNMNFGGSATVNGNVFASNTISFTGSNAEINGDAFSPSDITNTDNINGTAYSGVIPIPSPQIDLQPYYDIASTSGTLFTTTTDAQTYLNGNPITAVVFVDDTSAETDIQTVNLTGSLAVNGNLRLRGGTVITATNNYAAVVVDGNLRITGDTTINGVVYVSGNTTFGGGNNTINGSLISVGGTSIADITGHTTIYFSTTTVANWQNLTGLSTTTTSTLRITQWREQ